MEVVERPRFRFSSHQFQRMAALGLFGEDERVELIDGEVLAMPPIGEPHQSIVDRLNRLFTSRLGDRVIVRVQGSVVLPPHSVPQPDVSLLRPRVDFYWQGHPGPHEVFLLVEVSDTTLESDRDDKMPVYARSGITELWIVDVQGEQVEVYRGPGPLGYRETVVAGRGENLAAQAFPDDMFGVDEILG